MFSFLLGVITAIEAGKQKIVNKAKKYKEQRDKINSQMNGGQVSEDGIVENSASEEKKTIKVQMLSALTSVVLFFETLPLFFSLIFWIMVILCLVVLVIIIFSMMALIQNILEDTEKPDFKHNKDETTEIGGTCGPSGGMLSWTDNELATRGIALTDYEKNLYRMGIIARKAAEGYGGGELMVTDGATLSTRIAFLMGVSSAETSMRFYSGGENHDITKIPSTIAANSSGYGFMGISKDKTLQSYYSENVANKIKSQYAPSNAPVYAAAFAPYGVAMSAKHHHNDLKMYINTKKTKARIDAIAEDWGIKANRKEFSALTQFFLAQAEYHGSNEDDDFTAVINFSAALFVATSDTDSERSFDNWSLKIADDISKNDYSESGIRNTFVGSGGKDSLAGKSSASQLTGLGNTKVMLNGKELTKPVWAYLGEKYGDREGFKFAWKNAQYYSAIGGGAIGARVLNFHYGFNSYLQSRRVEVILAKKMNILGRPATSEDCNTVGLQPGNFKATPGKGQATIDGKSTEEFIKDWLSKNSGNKADYIKGLQAHWGTSSFLMDVNNVAKKAGYVDKIHGVPFQGQSSAYKESYGTMPYVPGGNTFYKSACMIYSYAYAASAMTGVMINPAEMGAIVHAHNGFVESDIITTKLPEIYKKMGLQSKRLVDGKSFEGFDETLKKGGVVVIRTIPGPENFTKYQHFQVITGMEEKGGKIYYHMYTSSSHTQSMTLYTEEQIKRNMHREALMVWK